MSRVFTVGGAGDPGTHGFSNANSFPGFGALTSCALLAAAQTTVPNFLRLIQHMMMELRMGTSKRTKRGVREVLQVEM